MTFDIFDGPVHVLPLGYTRESEGVPVRTVGDYEGGNRRGYILEHSVQFFLDTVHPDEIESDIPVLEQRLLLDLANNGIVAILPEGASASTLNLIPVMRKNLVVDADLGDEGYRLTGEGHTVVVSDLALRVLLLVGGVRTVSDIMESLSHSLLDPTEEEAWVGEVTDRALDQLLTHAALELFTVFHKTGVGTLEPTS